MELKQLTNESSVEFLQGMINRMDLSYAKYGRYRVNHTGELKLGYIKDLTRTLMDFLARWDNQQASSASSNAVSSIILRLIKYLHTGNTEWLMDVANFAMIEFECPQVGGSHFRATDSRESPGLVGISEKEMESLR